MFGKLIAASAVVSLLSATAAFAQPAATTASVAKIQDLSRARRHLDTHKRSRGTEVGTVVLATVGGFAAGFGIDEATKSNP